MLDSAEAYYVIAFIDIVGYSRLRGFDQYTELERLRAEVLRTTFGRLFSDRKFGVLLSTGDGVIAASSRISSTPHHALKFVEELREAMQPTLLRCGLHLGIGFPFRDVSADHYRDPDLPNNVASVAINEAQRIMSLADPGQILASKAFVDAVKSHVKEGRIAESFHELGFVKVKHGKSLDICLYEPSGSPKQPARVRILNEVQGDVIKALDGINSFIRSKFSKVARTLKPRVTLLLHDPHRQDLWVTRFRVGDAVSPQEQPSVLRFGLDEGPGLSFSRAVKGDDDVGYFELASKPDLPLSVHSPYVIEFHNKSNIAPDKIVQFRRPSQAYMYFPVPQIGAGDPLGVVSVDAMVPMFGLEAAMAEKARKGRGILDRPPKWLRSDLQSVATAVRPHLRTVSESFRKLDSL